MPFLERDSAQICYEEHGEDFPVLLIAPDGMRSAAPFWTNTPCNRIEHLSPHDRLLLLSRGTITLVSHLNRHLDRRFPVAQGLCPFWQHHGQSYGFSFACVS